MSMSERVPGPPPYEYHSASTDMPGGPEEKLSPLYTSLEDIPPPTYYEVFDVIKKLYPDNDQLAQRLLADPDNNPDNKLFPLELSGRLRTTEAIQLALRTTLGDALSSQGIYNSYLIGNLYKRSIVTIDDFYKRKLTDEEYALLRQTHSALVQSTSASLAQQLQILPHAVLATIVLGHDRLAAPIIPNTSRGLEQEQAIRYVVEKRIAKLPAWSALALTLRYLYQDVGMSSLEMGRHLGRPSKVWASGEVKNAIRALRGPRGVIAKKNTAELFSLVLAPNYADAVMYVNKEERDFQLVKTFRQHALDVLTSWEVQENEEMLSQQLGQVLNSAGAALDNDVSLFALRLPYEENSHIRQRVLAFNRLLDKFRRRLESPRGEVGSIRDFQEDRTKIQNITPEEVRFAKAAFERNPLEHS